jgi:FlgN protein
MNSTYALQPAVAPSLVPGTTIEALTDALSSEWRLLQDLIAIMRRQREAVARDDLQAVDESVYATQRVLLTLGEARRRRRSLNRLMGEAEDAGLRRLDDVLGEQMTDALRAVRDGLIAAALELSKEVEINRRVLRQALAAGDDYVRALYGAPEAKLFHPNQSANAGEAPASGGLLINRQV